MEVIGRFGVEEGCSYFCRCCGGGVVCTSDFTLGLLELVRFLVFRIILLFRFEYLYLIKGKLRLRFKFKVFRFLVFGFFS